MEIEKALLDAGLELNIDDGDRRILRESIQEVLSKFDHAGLSKDGAAYLSRFIVCIMQSAIVPNYDEVIADKITKIKNLEDQLSASSSEILRLTHEFNVLSSKLDLARSQGFKS